MPPPMTYRSNRRWGRQNFTSRTRQNSRKCASRRKMRFRFGLFGRLRQNSKFPVVERSYSGKNAPACPDGKHRALRDKVAIVTGGANGMGLQYVKEFLKRGAVGVTIADINSCNGERAVKTLCDEYGRGRVMYVRCDVTKSDQFDWAYKQTLKFFKRIDVVVNNAGIMNDVKWEHSIATNIGGCVIGSLLAIQYMSRACIGRGGVVVNVASTSGIVPYCGSPIYSMTQSAIITLSRALGDGRQYDRTGVKLIAFCVGPTDTELLKDGPVNAMNVKFTSELLDELEEAVYQPVDFVGEAMIDVMQKARTGSAWICHNCETPYEIALPDNPEALKCE